MLDNIKDSLRAVFSRLIYLTNGLFVELDVKLTLKQLFGIVTLGATKNGRRLAPNLMKGGDKMVTYSELFQFVIMLVAVITLVYNCTKK